MVQNHSPPLIPPTPPVRRAFVLHRTPDTLPLPSRRAFVLQNHRISLPPCPTLPPDPLPPPAFLSPAHPTPEAVLNRALESCAESHTRGFALAVGDFEAVLGEFAHYLVV